MTDPDTPLFRLLDPEGKEIMSGPLNILMECLPDTNARNEAIESMYQVASATVEAEERANEARAAAAQVLSDGITRLTTRLDTYIEQAEREAALEQARKDTARLAEMPPSPGDSGELQATKDAPSDPMARDEPEEEQEDPELPRAGSSGF